MSHDQNHQMGARQVGVNREYGASYGCVEGNERKRGKAKSDAAQSVAYEQVATKNNARQRAAREGNDAR